MEDYLEENHTGDMARVLQFVEQHYGAEVLEDPILHEGSLALVPGGIRVEHIGKHLAPLLHNPRRRRGKVVLLDEVSFIDWMNRSKVEGASTIYADEKCIVGIVNDDELDLPEEEGPSTHNAGWRDFFGYYQLPMSPAWMAWVAASGRSMDQRSFAEFLEERILDVLAPEDVGDGARKIADALGVSVASPSSLMELSRGLTIRVNSKVAQAVNLSTGEAQLQYAEEHVGEKGAPLKVPGAFAIGIPIFNGGALYSLPVRLRYRLSEGTMHWTIQLLRQQESFDDAFADMLARIKAGTGLPVFRGRPGAAR